MGPIYDVHSSLLEQGLFRFAFFDHLRTEASASGRVSAEHIAMRLRSFDLNHFFSAREQSVTRRVMNGPVNEVTLSTQGCVLHF